MISYHACPHCGEEIEMEIIGEYEPDTNARPVAVVNSISCDCNLTDEEWGRIEIAAMESFQDAENLAMEMDEYDND